MSQENPVPTTSSMCLHHVDRMRAKAMPDNGGAFCLEFHNSGWETFGITTFTGNGDMAIELAAAINAVLAKHGFLKGQSDAAPRSVAPVLAQAAE